MQAARLLAATRLRHVDATRGELALEFDALELGLARFDQRADGVARPR